MAQENINIVQPNFCIYPLLGTFATVDTTNVNALLLVKNSTGVVTVSYTFNPNITQNTNIYYLDYIGPRELSASQSGMLFVTMESNLTSSVTIKKWKLDKANNRLNLDSTIIKTSSGYDTIVSKNMAVGRYYTNLSLTTITGTGNIVINNTDSVVSGTKLYVGPSTNTSYLGAYEEVEATSVSGTTVYIKSSSGVPLHSYFNSGDPVTYLGNMYLFSDVGYAADNTKGALLVLSSYDGTIMERNNNALYNNIKTANYGIPYYNTVCVIKNNELLYIDVNDFSTVKSSRLNVTKINSSTVLDVKAIACTLSTIYRLQKIKMVRSDTGAYSEITWTTYNYHEDSSYRYVDCLSLYTNSSRLANQDTITIFAKVIDQYGMGVSNKTVHFNKEYGDTGGVWGNVNKEGITDINGECSITYTSSWYNSTIISVVNEDIKVTAYTDGSNILTGSIYVWAFLFLRLDAKFLLDRTDLGGLGVPLIVQKIDSKSNTNTVKQVIRTSNFVLRSLSKFKFPGGHETFQSFPLVPIVKQLSSFKCTLTEKQLADKTGKAYPKQVTTHLGNCPLSQTVVSRHLPTGSNTDNVFIAQFKFLIDAVPALFSYKNNVNTTIWLRLAPYGFDLNKSTLIFKVREVSYVCDTGFIDYYGSSQLVVTEFDAGGGLIGLDILYTPQEYFHNDAIVYVYLSVYDSAIPPNIIELDYWFEIIPDYKAPYITNESPVRNATKVPITSDISFDILDTEVGVDISSLELYINNRNKSFSYYSIVGGFRVTYNNENIFYYNQDIEVAIQVNDSSGQKNILYDMWKFQLISSVAPSIDFESITPKACARGLTTRITVIKFILLDDGNGIDANSIELLVDNTKRDYKVTPIIKRIL
jgi:hypothetical protein